MTQWEKLIDRKFLFSLISEGVLTFYALKVNMDDIQYVIGFSGIVGGYLAIRYFEGRNNARNAQLNA